MAVLHFMLKLLIFPHCGRMMNTVQMAPAPVLMSLAIRKKTIKTPDLLPTEQFPSLKCTGKKKVSPTTLRKEQGPVRTESLPGQAGPLLFRIRVWASLPPPLLSTFFFSPPPHPPRSHLFLPILLFCLFYIPSKHPRYSGQGSWV